jgi:hypothetical protein
MDQQQPQWTPPPQQPMGWGGPGYGGAPVRPTSVTMASIFLIVMGILLSLAGAACGLLGGAASQIGSGTASGNPFAVFGGAIAIIGIIILVLGILSIAAGAGALGGKGWARWTGIVISVILAILLILGGVSSFSAQSGATSGIFTLVIGVLYALTAWSFIKSTAWFSRR